MSNKTKSKTDAALESAPNQDAAGVPIPVDTAGLALRDGAEVKPPLGAAPVLDPDTPAPSSPDPGPPAAKGDVETTAGEMPAPAAADHPVAQPFAVDVSAADPVPAGREWRVVISARRDGFRRAGIAHPAQPTSYPVDRFSSAELEALLAEPMLQVSLV
jgi:hypothetical protein